jgi:hypothetical protein
MIPNMINVPRYWDDGDFPQPNIYWYDIKNKDGSLITGETERLHLRKNFYIYYPDTDFYKDYR